MCLGYKRYEGSSIHYLGGNKMKSQLKSLLNLKMVIVLVSIMILVACSSDSNSNNAGTEQNSGDQNVTDVTDDNQTERGSITSSLYDRGNVPADEGTIEDNRWTRWINENGPVDIEFVSVPRWESQQAFNVLFASKSAPDLILEYDTAFRNQLYNQQLIQPIDDMIEQYSTTYKAMIEEYPALRKVGTKDDGLLYEFARVIGLQPNHALWIRADWLDELGLEVPQTTDDLYEVAKAFNENDPDRNNIDDTYGMALSHISGMIVDYMFGSVFTIFEKQPWYPNSDDQLVHDWERTQGAFEFKKRVFDAGLVDRDFLTDAQGEKAKQDFINGKLGIWGTTMGDFSSYEALKQNNPEARIKVIPLPESPFGQFSPVLYNPVQSVAVVNVLAEDPQAVMQYVDFMVSPEVKFTLQNGIEGEHYELENGCPVRIDSEEVRKQFSYNGDIGMLFSDNFSDPCFGWWNWNESNATPLQLEFKELRFDAVDAYINKARPNPALTHSEHMPILPEDLQINQQNGFKAVEDTLTRSIISGSSYTVEEAIVEAKSAWEKANGEKIDQWYNDWYAENKDHAFLMDDMYEMVEDVFFRP